MSRPVSLPMRCLGLLAAALSAGLLGACGSGDEQALRLHESLVARLWDSALVGSRAIDEIERLIAAQRAER